MKVRGKPFSQGYQTNCYIAMFDGFEFVIDPGQGAYQWIKQECKNPVAILLTHAHFDHIWDVKQLQEEMGLPVYIYKDDVFLLAKNQANNPTTMPDVEVSSRFIEIHGIRVEFIHVPGHTPGLCMIRIGDIVFSGDFIFARSIGRFDFPYSNENDMKNSLKSFLNLEYNAVVYPGHGEETDIQTEQHNVAQILKAYRWD